MIFNQIKNKRTLLAIKNIFISFIFKFISMFTMLALVSVSIKYLGKLNYGVWITISSMIGWMGMFDFGLAHGLRNKLTEALAKKDYKNAKSLIISTYVFLFFISFIILIILLLLINNLNWKNFLNLPNNFNMGLFYKILILFSIFFVLQFTLKPINAILQAIQWPSIIQVIGTFNSIIIFILIYVAYISNLSPALFYYVLIMGIIPNIGFLLITLYIFYKLKYLRPSLEYFHIKSVKLVSGLGISFFIIQLSLIVVNSSDNIIISHLFGPNEVTLYNVIYKYFSILIITFNVIMAPFWSAITDAYVKKEFNWIKKTIKILLFFLLIEAIIVLMMVMYSEKIIHIWIDKNFFVSKQLVILMGLYTISLGVLTIFSYFSNGIGKIKIQMIAYIIASIVNIPLSIYFGKFLGLGVNGVLIATLICVNFVSLILIIQYIKIINNKATGIWSK